MRTIFLPGVIALALGTWAGAAPADAQVPPGCPPGYTYGSDGQCYPAGATVYAPPVYEVAPPVYQPPFVYDGYGPGIGIGIGLGFGGRDGGGGRGGGGRGGRR